MKMVICFLIVLLIPSMVLAETTVKVEESKQPDGWIIIFYEKDKEVGRQSLNFNDGVVPDTIGNIPDGTYKVDLITKSEREMSNGEFTYKKNKLIKIKAYDLNNHLRVEINYKNGKPNGVSREYNENGKLEQETNYKNGKYHGIRKTYSENGKLIGKGDYKNGIGIYKEYYDNGELKIMNESFKDDKMLHRYYLEDGGAVELNYLGNNITQRKHYNENGKLMTLEDLANNISTTYYENDGNKLKSRFNHKNGEYKEYYESGKLLSEGNFKNGKQEGITKEYYESGNLRVETNYKDGKREGISKRYYESGKLNVEWNYKDGKLEGISKWYGKDGISLTREQNYKDDKIEGMKIYVFYEDMSAAGEINYNYKNDKLEGISTKYDKNGILLWETNYKNDKRDGLQRRYSDDGKIEEINTYKNDCLINSKKYDSLGQLILDQDYPYEVNVTDGNVNQTLSDTLRTCFIKAGKFTVLERSKMDEILKEQKFQLTGCTTTECAVEIGKILNVNYMVICSIGKVAKEHIINIRIISIESSEAIIADMEKCDLEQKLISSLENIVERIARKMATTQVANKLKSIAVLDIENK